MPYESPNIVIVPNTTAKMKLNGPSQKPREEYPCPVSAKVFHSAITNTTPDVLKPTNVFKNKNKVANDVTTAKNATVFKPKVTKHEGTQSDVTKQKASMDNNSAATVPNKPSINTVFDTVKCVRPSANAKSTRIKVNLISTSKDSAKTTVNDTSENKSIKLNLLSSKPTDTTTSQGNPVPCNNIVPPMVQPPESSAVINPYLNSIWSCPSQLSYTNQTVGCGSAMGTPWNYPAPPNLNIDTTLCMGTTYTLPSQWQISTNMEFRPRMEMTLSHPPVGYNTPAPNIDGRPVELSWNCPSQLSTNWNVNSGPCFNTTWSYSTPFQNSTESQMKSMSCENMTSIQLPYDTGFESSMDTNIWPIQEFHTNTIQQSNFNNSPTFTVSKETTQTATSFHDTPKSNWKSPMDYTWLTRAHYADIKHPAENLNTSKNKEALDNKTNKNQNSVTKSTKCSSKVPSENEKKNNNSKKIMHKVERNKIEKAIKDLETKIKKITADKKPFKIPKISKSKTESVESKAKKSSDVQHKSIKDKIECDKIKRVNEKSTSKKRSMTPEKKSRKHSHLNLDKDNDSSSKKRKITHSIDLETKQRSARLKLNTEAKSPPRIKTSIDRDCRKEGKSLDLQCKNKYKHKSEIVEPAHQKVFTKRKSRSSATQDSTPKRIRRENDANYVKVTPIKSVIKAAKSNTKHPRVQAPENVDTDDTNLVSDFDLRSKLSRTFEYNKGKTFLENESKDKDFLRENLLITVNQNSYGENTSKSETSNTKQKTKKYKKIRLVINVIHEDTSDDSLSDVDNNGKATPLDKESSSNRKLDLSFLDDFNVDEIVDSLKFSPKINDIQQQNVTQRNVINTEPSSSNISNKFEEPIIIKDVIKTEQIDLDTSATSDLESLKSNMYEQSLNSLLNNSNELINEDVLLNLKKESQEDKTIKVNTDNSNTNIQTSINQDIFQTMNYLLDMVENMQVRNVIPSLMAIGHNVKCEPYENNDGDAFENNSEACNRIAENYNLKIENDDTQVLPDMSSEKSNVLENQNVYKILQSGKYFGDINQAQASTNTIPEAPLNSSSYKIANSNYSTKSDVIIIDNNCEVEIKSEIVETATKVDFNIAESLQDQVKKENLSDTYDSHDIIIINDKNDTHCHDIIVINDDDDEITKTTSQLDENKFKNEHTTNFSNVSVVFTNENNDIKLINDNENLIEAKKENNTTTAISDIREVMNENNEIHMCQNLEPLTEVILKQDIEGKCKELFKTNINVNSKVRLDSDYDTKNTKHAKSTQKAATQHVAQNMKKTIEDVSTNDENTKLEIRVEDVKEINEEKSCIDIPKISTLAASEINKTDKNYDIKNKSIVIETIIINQNAHEKNSNDLTNTTAKTAHVIDNQNQKAKISCNLDVTIIDKTKNEGQGFERKTTNNTCIKPKDNPVKAVKESNSTELSNGVSSTTRSVKILNPSLKSNKVLAIKIEEKIYEQLKLKLNVTSLLHHGHFSKVFKGEDTNGHNYALKIVTYEKNGQNLGSRKLKMLKELQNDVPKVNQSIIYMITGFGLDNTWCFLMEYYPMTLAKALKDTQFIIETVKEFTKQLVSAVLMMRTNNIIHSDIKPEHVLINLEKTRLKLCGFDAAYYADDKIQLLPNIGSALYRPPEIILGYSAGFSIDVWATALVMYEIAVGSKLFSGALPYNSDILFHQMSLCGRMPMCMIESGIFSYLHFNGMMFKRLTGHYGQHILYNVNSFNTKMYTYTSLRNGRHGQLWCTLYDKARKNVLTKLMGLSCLLDKMLVLDPDQRIPIEYVYTDNFFNRH